MTRIDTASVNNSLKVRPLGAPLGAEIDDVDLSLPLSPEGFAAVEDALHQYQVIVFRNQRIDDAQQIHFSKLFGDELDIHPMHQFAKPDNPEIFILSNIVENGRAIGAVDAAQYWHSDLCYTKTPSRVSIMYAIEVPVKEGKVLGPTEFSNTAAAYRALPADVKKKLEGARARFSAGKKKPSKNPSHFNKLDDATKNRLEESVVHPVVRTHPYTGERSIYVNPGFTTEIIDVDRAESDEMLSFLFDHMTKERFIYRHSWAVGDVVVCDNALTIHQGVGNYSLPQRRLIHRTIIKGSEPF